MSIRNNQLFLCLGAPILACLAACGTDATSTSTLSGPVGCAADAAKG